MNLTDVKPLQKLTHGSVLIVGGKASNFDDEIRTHPRIIMWDSQNQHWDGKELPQNVRAVFITRFIGHVAFGKILASARKRQLTIFNPEGTGMIVKQVRELLGLAKPTTVEIKPTMVTTTTPVKTGGKTLKGHSKLNDLMQFHDANKTIVENARLMFEKAKEQGIETTVGSLAQKVSVMRRKERGATVKVPRPGVTRSAKMDVSVEILDNVIKELQDMRDYVVAVTKENEVLKSRIEKFKKVLASD
jgi:flagellin-like hook-associated protein FlgL